MRIYSGVVIQKKMAKTATVLVERTYIHPLYRKRVKRTKKYHVHDEIGTNVGDRVKFIDSRPYSKTKKWRILEVIGQREGVKEKPKKEGRENDSA